MREFCFESAGQFLKHEMTIEYLVEDVIEKGTIGVMFGETGAGKSFIAIDLGLSVAVGVEIFNDKLAEKGTVLYVNGEGRNGVKRRVKAWQHRGGYKPEDIKHFYLSEHTISLNGEGVEKVIEEGKKCEDTDNCHVALIIVDTLARHMIGDENSSKDMCEFIKAMENLQSSFPMSVLLIVHHTGKKDHKTARGSSALKGAMDFEISVNKTDEGEGNIRFTKMKDSERPDDIGFKTFEVVVGIDKKGKAITSCVVEYVAVKKKISGVSIKGLEIEGIEALINICISENKIIDGKYYAEFENWKQAYSQVRMEKDPSTNKRAVLMSFSRSGEKGILEKLKNKGVISVIDDMVLPLREQDQAKISDGIKRADNAEHGT